MAFWTTAFLNKMRQEWMRRIAKVQYQAGSTWYDAVITKKEVVGNEVQITTTTTDSSNITIKAVRLIDTSGEIAGQRTESITKLGTQSVLTIWKFPIYEVTS